MEVPTYTDEELTATLVGTDLIVTDPTGKTYTIHHFGAGKGRLQLDPRIDLTKPIFEQAQKLRILDDEMEAHAASSELTEHSA